MHDPINMTRHNSKTDNATNLPPVLQYNIISKIDTFYDFINGFNSVDELVTFTNVGRGKEVADTKIKGGTPI